MNIRTNAHLFQNVKRLVDFIEKETKNQLEHTPLDDLALAEIKILDAIGMEGGKTIKEIAEYLNVALSTPTKTMDRLVSKGYIIREIGKQDRRIVVSKLTDKGKEALNEIMNVRQDTILRVLDKLSNEDQHELNRIVQNILISI